MQPRKVFGFMGGMDRSKTPGQADLSSFYDLLNFRQSPGGQGELVQTPYFKVNTTQTAGTYYDLHSTSTKTEPAASAIRGVVTNVALQSQLAFTDFCASVLGGAQIPIYYQSLVPSGVTLFTQCFIVIKSVAGLALALGDTLDITIDAAGTFKWRKSGGAWTAGVACSTSGTAIDGGNVIVYFLANTGFTVADTWSWTRTDYMVSPPSGSSFAGIVRTLEYETYGTDTYYLNYNGRLMMLRTNGTELYCISAGYRPVHATHFSIFYGHVFLIGYSVNPYYSTSSMTLSALRTIVNSDNVDIQCFFATDTNEADSYTLPINTVLVGCFVLGTRLSVLTLDSVWYTDYAALPTPFDFKKLVPLPIDHVVTGVAYITVPNRALVCSSGVYLMTTRGLLRFDGTNFTEVSTQIYGLLSSFSSWFYNGSAAELVIYNSGYLYCLQERTNTWYRRAAYFDATYSVGCISKIGSTADIVLGTNGRIVLDEDTTFAGQPVYDTTATSYATPTITTHCFTNNAQSLTKEIEGLFIQAVTDTGGSATYYTIGTSVTYKFYWYKLDTGRLSGATPTTDTNAVWTSAAPDGQCAYPRLGFRALALEVRIVGTVSKPGVGARVFALDPCVPEESLLTPSAR